MTRYIDADALIEQIDKDSKGNSGWYGDTWQFMKTIDNAQTIDAVEVVRCKDCMYWLQNEQFGFDADNEQYHDYCALLVPDDEYYAFSREANDYCSYGERETE